MAELSIATLGNLRVTLEGEPVRGFRTDKERALLVYLAVERDRPHRREKLAGLLWPDFPEANARHTLSQALTDLRSALGDRSRATPCLVANRATVELNAAIRTWVDVQEFNGLLRREQHEEVQPFGADVLERLRQAVTLYQGTFLSGFSLADAPGFEEWQLMLRERLHRQVTDALAQLVARYAERDDPNEALRYAWRLVELDPWRETAQRELIRLLALTGQRGAALRQYEALTHILDEELGVEPDAESQALLEAVRAGEFDGRRAPVPSAPPSSEPFGAQHTQNVPTPLMPLIGRDAELQILGARLREADSRLLTLVGPGGIGKTRLALELLRDHTTCFSDGAFVVPLVATTSWEACLGAIASSVGLVASEQSGAVEDQLKRFLLDKEVLLLLDNVEQLLDHAPRIVQLLEAAPRLHIVATSRARLGVMGEVAITVDALAVPADEARLPRELAEVASVKLFLHAARQVASKTDLAPDNAGAIAAICREVEGMPLALLLAAAWMDVLTPGQILARLTGESAPVGSQPVDFLRAAWPDVPERQRSMRAVFDHSWRLMRIRDQAVLQALSVFRGGFSTEAAFYVAGASLREIRRLVGQSLLGRLSGGRFGIHELLRQYAAERLSSAAAAERVARDRHASYYVNTVERWFEDAKGPRQVAALTEMDAEIDNARTAWEWIVAQGDGGQIARAVDGLCLYYVRRGRLEEAVAACQEGFARLEALSMGSDAEEAERQITMARLSVWESEVASGDEGVASVDRALNLLAADTLASRDVRLERGRALRSKGNHLWNTDREQTLACYEESLALLRATGDDWEVARTLDRLSDLTLLFPDFAAARAYAEELLASGRSRGDLHAMAWALHGLAGVALYGEGNLEASIGLAQESLAVRRELADPLELVTGLQYLAVRWVLAGRLERAMPLFREAEGILDRLGMPAPYARGVLAWGLMLSGRYAEARDLAQRALAEANETGERRLVAWNNHVLGSLALADGAVDEAVERLSYSVAEFREMQEMVFMGMVLAYLSYAHRARAERTEALACAAEALRMGTTLRARPILSCALPGMALLYADEGRAEKAVTLNTVVRQCCGYVVDSTWFAQLAGTAYHAAIAALAPERVAEAEGLGLVSDMQTEALAVLAELDGVLGV